ncbi:MAG TPA: TIM-barrel domain-containing protein [bacterium]|nr:TIM-barrel domain-containing protein [bacterium]
MKDTLDPPFPAWVFGHVVWEDESTTQSVYDLVHGYLTRGVPVDAVIIDSPWETAYNDFVVDEERYPDMGKLIADLHANGIRVIFWITAMVNQEDSEYQSALEHGYFVKGMEARSWWKGTGGMLDYDNPEALQWWHQRMDRALELGIDGWKVDGTDPLMLYQGWKRRQDYATKYYSDFYDYSREKTGRKIVAMARPMEQGINESTLHLPGWANPLGLGVWLRFAPVEKSFASWVGDQDPTFDGLAIARRHVLRSAREGYLIIGSDIGGYRGGGPYQEVLLRWAQFGALTPFMENGGIGEHRPWRFDDETLDIYRAYALLHQALGPYLYSEAVEAWRQGRSLILPLGSGEEYLLGRDVLVAPVRRAGGKVRVTLPQGDDWWPLFTEADAPELEKCRIRNSGPPLLSGGCSFTHAYGLASYPVFFRAGALVPVDVADARPLFAGILELAGKSRAVLVVPSASPVEEEARLTVHEEGKIDLIFTGAVRPGAADWPSFVVASPWPTIPEDAPAIGWR